MPEHYQLIIIGGGPAGMAVAFSAYQAGLQNILLLERLPKLGGILNQCIHVGFGLHYFKEELTGTEYAARYRQLLRGTGVQVLGSAFVHTVTARKTVTYLHNRGEHRVSADHIVLATGCRERTREMLTVPGTRPAGIYTAGLAQEMTNIRGVLPGKNVVIIGSGDIGLIMARRMTLEGAKVIAVLEIMDHLSGLVRNKVQCLDDFGIPLHLEHELLEVYGRNRVEGIRYRDNKSGEKKTFECDTLLFSVGLIPEQDLFAESKILEEMPSFHLIGNAHHVHELADHVTKAAEILGRDIAEELRNG